MTSAERIHQLFLSNPLKSFETSVVGRLCGLSRNRAREHLIRLEQEGRIERVFKPGYSKWLAWRLVWR